MAGLDPAIYVSCHALANKDVDTWVKPGKTKI